MKFSFIFGFILLILLIIGVFVGLPYAIQSFKSGAFSFPISLPKISTKLPSSYFPNRPQQNETPAPISQQNVKKVSISGVSRYGQNGISLQASYFSNNDERVDITGWKIKSFQKGETVIGKGINLFQFEAASSDIWLSSNDSADIVAGLSPLGGNFRANNCFGWLNNLYNFGYSLSYCPGGFNVGDLAGLDSACQDLILRTASCRTPSENDLNRHSYRCRQWVSENMTYNACVVKHRNDGDFYKGWKIYVGNQIFDPLHDRIELRDQAGLLVDSYEY